MILSLIFLALLRLAWLMKDQIYTFVNGWREDVRDIKPINENTIILYKDINFHSDDIRIESGDETIIYERTQTDTSRAQGANNDFWHFRSMKIQKNLNYHITVYTDENKYILPFNNTDYTEIENIMFWIYRLPPYARDKINDFRRQTITIGVVS